MTCFLDLESGLGCVKAHQILTPVSQVQSQGNPRMICVEQNGNEATFSLSTSFFSLPVIVLPMLHTHTASSSSSKAGTQAYLRLQCKGNQTNFFF